MITGDTILASWPGPPQGIRDTPLAANTANVFVLVTELETEMGEMWFSQLTWLWKLAFWDVADSRCISLNEVEVHCALPVTQQLLSSEGIAGYVE